MFTIYKWAVGHSPRYLIVAGFLLVVSALAGQSSQTRTSEPLYPADQKAVREAMAELKAGKVNLHHVRVLGKAKTVEAIPYLEKEFANTTDILDKALLAQVLVELEDTNGEYWDFLANLVEQALTTDEPNLFAFDSQGKLIPGVSPDFKAWAKANGLDESAQFDAVRMHPAEVLYLAFTEDKRAIPLLRRALGSRNYYIQANAARGLAALGDSASVPLIIQSASIAPADAAEIVASSLLYFDDEDAQKAFDLYVPKERAQALREVRAKGTGPIP